MGERSERVTMVSKSLHVRIGLSELIRLPAECVQAKPALELGLQRKRIYHGPIIIIIVNIMDYECVSWANLPIRKRLPFQALCPSPEGSL